MTYFVTGTDTNIGKTVACAWLVQKLKANYWKPIQSGVSEGRDIDTITELSHCCDNHIIPGIYEFQAPLSPHQAAAAENKSIQLNKIVAAYSNIKCQHPLIIEGAGGLLVPLNNRMLMIDLIRAINSPTILVTRTALGTINHTLLSLEALRSRSIPIAGVIAIGEPNPSNINSIEKYGDTRVIAHIPLLSPLNYDSLSAINFRTSLCT